MKVKKILFVIFSAVVDLFFAILILRNDMVNMLNFVLFLLIILEFCFYNFYFAGVKNKRYSEIEKLYRDKENRYKNLYTYLSELYNNKDVESKFLIRTIKVNNATDKIVLPLIGVMLALFTLLYNNFEKMLIAPINIMCNILNYNVLQINYNIIENSVSTFCFFSLIFILLMFKKMVYTIGIKTYVNYVIEDVERDRSTYDNHGISSNKTLINSLKNK